MQDPNKLLKTAVADMVRGINDDKLSAHDAVVKTAKELDLNVNFIKRACEVINVALTYEHFRKHADQRDTDFPIVDPQKVAAEIFPDSNLSKPQKKSAMFAGTLVEERVPDFLKAKYNANFKEAFVKLKEQEDEKRVMSDAGICEKAGYARQNLHQHLDNCRTELVGVKEGIASKFASLVNGWSKDPASRISFADFESQVFSKHGEASTPYLDLIYTASNCKEARGEHDAKHIAFDDSPETLLFESFLTDTSKLGEALNKVAEAASLLTTAEANLRDAYRKLGEARLTELQENSISEPIQTEAVKEAEEIEDPVLAAAQKKIAEFNDIGGANLPSMEDEAKYLTFGQRRLPVPLKAKIIASKKSITENIAKEAGAFDMFLDQYKKHSTPSGLGIANSPLDNLDRKLLIQDLMVTDPILKTYEPKKVVAAYEQFLRLAPELSTEKEIVRSHLRQMVAAQALGVFDGVQLMDANTKLMKQHMMEAGVKPPKEEK